jgi:putative sigma-54 modulation protein
MDITISGRHVKVTEALHDYAQEKTSKFERIWQGISKIQVILKLEHDLHVVEAIVSINGGENIVATTKAPDMYAALDLMEEKVEHQLRRLKSKLQDHHPKKSREKSASGGSDEPSYQDIVNEEMNPG